MKTKHEIRLSKPSSGCSKAALAGELASVAFRSKAVEEATLAYRLRIAFGQNLRQARIDASLTLEDVAGISGLSVRYINQIEAGRHDPRMKAMTALAHAVDRELWTLLTLPSVGADDGVPAPSYDIVNA